MRDQEESFLNYEPIKNYWEEASTKVSKKILDQGVAYINNIPRLVGTGPSVTLLLDLNKSEIRACSGQFERVFGIEYRKNLSLNELAIFTHPLHSSFIARHFHSYLSTLLKLSIIEREKLELSVIFKYEKGGKYVWINQRACKYFGSDAKKLGLVVLECTDITTVKTDSFAKFLVFDERNGHLINEIFSPKSLLFYSLTPTEMTLTREICIGISDKEIAASLNMALNTVKQHKKNIFKKLKVSKSIELVSMAFEAGVATKNNE